MRKITRNVIKLPKGPQFGVKGGAFLFILTFILISMSVVQLIEGLILSAIIFFLMGSCLFFLIVNIRIVEINIRKSKIRDYKWFLWLKIGRWQNVNSYSHVYLTKGLQQIPTSDYSEHAYDNFYYFFVKLVNEHEKKEILISEFKDYSKAAKLLKHISRHLNLEAKVNVRRLEKLK